jgi:hypothetical protein
MQVSGQLHAQTTFTLVEHTTTLEAVLLPRIQPQSSSP